MKESINKNCVDNMIPVISGFIYNIRVQLSHLPARIFFIVFKPITIKNSSEQMRQLFAYVANACTLCLFYKFKKMSPGVVKFYQFKLSAL